MAKQLIRTYKFNPGGGGIGNIQIPGKWDMNQILLITNATQNVFLYNFADSAFAGTTVTFTRGNLAASGFDQILQGVDGYTTITLQVSTSAMGVNDAIQIFVDRNEMIVRPWAMGTDAFERTRMAAPTSMIDADFEYGLQPTKWQQIELVRNYPSIYEIPGSDLAVTSITTNASGGAAIDQNIQSLITVNCTTPHLLTTSTPISLAGLDIAVPFFNRAQGTFVVHDAPNSTQFRFYAKAKCGSVSGTELSTPYTVLRRGGFYTGASIGTSTFVVTGSGPTATGTVTVTFDREHGIVPGTTILCVISSDTGAGGNGHSLLQGQFYVQTVTTGTQLTFNCRNVGTVTGTPVGGIYGAPNSSFIHRALDGGVQLKAGGPQHGLAAIRQSKKYIRYQSGKAINYNTGALFAPSYNIRTITATSISAGGTITIQTDDQDHGLQNGAGVRVTGVLTLGYDGFYAVTNVLDERTFQVQTTQTLASTVGVPQAFATVGHSTWHGATVRAGTFDDQNGMYWQYDGRIMAVGQRNATAQLAGTVTVNPDSNFVTGTNSRFREQLVAGDRIVIAGMTHLVHTVTSATWMYVAPDYRGTTFRAGVKAAKIFDKLVPQTAWNLDRCDGSNGPFNPSGYYLDPAKMQMIGIQWTWYGAGFIDFMLRGPDGNYITVHRMKNSNINTEAYMRSGNMPVRYEVINESARSTLTNDISAIGTVMTLTDVTYFPNTGTVWIDKEFINFTGKSISAGPGSLTGLTRAQSLVYFTDGATRSFQGNSNAAWNTHSNGTGVILVSQTASPQLSHWGSALIQDGGFDSDRGYLFSYQQVNLTVTTQKRVAFGIRLAPSVSNAVVGDLGARDLINRAQLLLSQLANCAGVAASSNQALVIEGVVNPSNFPINPNNITWYSLQGSVTGGNTYGSGQPSFAQIAPSEFIRFDNTASFITSCTAVAAGSTIISGCNTASIRLGDAAAAPSFSGNSRVISIGSNQITLSLPTAFATPHAQSIQITRNFAAEPGETIFSFISNPSTKDELDLTQLKELTNTPLGGRGTFPNGPDCLFINVYLTQGNPIQTNLILRWGEAQA